METIFWIAVAMFCVAAIMVAVVVRKHNKMFSDKEDPIPDPPARYEDYEECFYNPEM
jgi:hypothetical protein